MEWEVASDLIDVLGFVYRQDMVLDGTRTHSKDFNPKRLVFRIDPSEFELFSAGGLEYSLLKV